MIVNLPDRAGTRLRDFSKFTMLGSPFGCDLIKAPPSSESPRVQQSHRYCHLSHQEYSRNQNRSRSLESSSLGPKLLSFLYGGIPSFIKIGVGHQSLHLLALSFFHVYMEVYQVSSKSESVTRAFIFWLWASFMFIWRYTKFHQNRSRSLEPSSFGSELLSCLYGGIPSFIKIGVGH